MNLFPESYKQHVNRVHILVVTTAALFLLIDVTWMVVVVIRGYDAYPKGIWRLFGFILFITVPLSIIAITLVIYSITSRFHKAQSEIYRKIRLETKITDRAELLKSFEYVKYYYSLRLTQRFAPLSIIPGLFMILALTFRSLFPFGLIAIFSTLMFVPLWIFHEKKKDDYVYLTLEGISYRSSSETGLLPWDTIKEISLYKQGYLIQAENRSLIIGPEIEPTSAPQPTFIKGLMSNNKYAKELIDQIQQLAPHVYYRRSFLERDIISKD